MTRRLAAALLALMIASPFGANAQGYGGHRGGGGGGGGWAVCMAAGSAARLHGGGYSRAAAIRAVAIQAAASAAATATSGPPSAGYRGPPPPARPGPGSGWAGSRTGPGVFGGSRMAEGGPRMSGPVRGEYLPPEARGSMVGDFQRFHLRRPPRGYAWYRSGDSFVLAGSNNGVIFEVTPADPAYFRRATRRRACSSGSR